MRKLVLVIGILILAATSAAAQQIDLKALDALAAKAKESVEITLDEAALKATSGIVTNKTGDEGAAKKVAEGLKGVYGRVFEFDGPYDRKVLEDIRKQLKAPQWSVVMRVREDTEEVEMWMHRTDGVMDGMLLIAAEENELVVFNLVGISNLSDLSKIGGKFGVPNIDLPGTRD
jgi:hypothetical protein